MFTLVLLALAGPPGGATFSNVPVPYANQAACQAAGEQAKRDLMPLKTGGIVTYTCLPGSPR